MTNTAINASRSRPDREPRPARNAAMKIARSCTNATAAAPSRGIGSSHNRISAGRRDPCSPTSIRRVPARRNVSPTRSAPIRPTGRSIIGCSPSGAVSASIVAIQPGG